MSVTPRRTHRVLAAVGAGALALTLAACGSSDAGTTAGGTVSPSTSASESAAPSLAPYEVVAASAEASIAAGTAKVALVVDTTAAGQSFTVTGDGVTDSSAGAAQMTTNVAIPGSEPLSIETIVVDGVVYVGGLPEQPAGEWLKVPADQAAAFGVDASASDPSAALAQMKAVNEDVTEVGTEELRGVTVTHYRGTLDVARTLEAMPAAQAESIRPVFESSGLTSIPFDLWLDGEGRPAKLTQVLDLTVEGQVVKTATTLELFDWGSAAPITAPDPASVVDAPVPAA